MQHFMQPYSSAEAGTTYCDRMANRISHPVYAHGVSWLSEFLGTIFFFFLALSGEQVAFSVAGPTGLMVLLYASLSHAFAFAVSAWIFFRVTSGLFNPAISLGMCCIRATTWLRTIVVMSAQLLGAMAAAGLVAAIFPGPLLPAMALSAETSTARGFFIELFLTMCFVLMVFMMACEKHKGVQFVAPMGLGLALFSVEMPSIVYTGGSLNPARAFAVALATHHWPSYHWIYWIAPLLGAIAAGLLFKFVKMLEHETAAAHRRGVQESKQEPTLDTDAETAAHPGTRLSTVPEGDVEKGESS